MNAGDPQYTWKGLAVVVMVMALAEGLKWFAVILAYAYAGLL